MSSNKIHVRCGCRSRKVKGPILGENVSNNLEKKEFRELYAAYFKDIDFVEFDPKTQF